MKKLGWYLPWTLTGGAMVFALGLAIWGLNSPSAQPVKWAVVAGGLALEIVILTLAGWLIYHQGHTLPATWFGVATFWSVGLVIGALMARWYYPGVGGWRLITFVLTVGLMTVLAVPRLRKSKPAAAVSGESDER